MPVTPTFPGVYIEEVPSGVRTITGVATSIAAFVGFTARGPVDRAVRLFNPGDFERTFGALHRDSEVAYAVRQFFENGGTDCYVVRVAAGAASATSTLRFATAAGNDALVASGADPGSWGNLVRLDVDFATSNPDSLFNVHVVRHELQGGALVAAEVEQFRNLSMNSRSATYAPAVVGASRLIRLTRPAGLAFDTRAFALTDDLGTFPTVAADQTTIEGVLDGFEPFTLVLPSAPTSAATLLTRLNTAISNAGLDRPPRRRARGCGGSDRGEREPPEAHVAGGRRQPEHRRRVLERRDRARGRERRVRGPDLRARERRTPGRRQREPAAAADRHAQRRPLDDPRQRHHRRHRRHRPGPLVGRRRHRDRADGLAAGSGRGRARAPGRAADPDPRDPGPVDGQRRRRAGRTAAARGDQRRHPERDDRLRGRRGDRGAADRRRLHVNVQQYALGIGAEVGGQTGTNPGADGTPPGATELLGSAAAKTGINALRDVDIFNILCIPRTAGLSEAQAGPVIAAATTLCEERRAFYIVDPPPGRTRDTIADFAAGVASTNAALYFPRINVADPLNGFRAVEMPASGAIAGAYARTDAERGVWKAPAGTDTSLRGVQSLASTLTDPENGVLNPRGVNALRTFPVFGTVVWGARTLDGDDQRASEWKYVPVRRLALFLEESLYRGTKWAVFEPNDEPLWSQLRLNVGAFMQNLFRQGAFQGQSARQAYFVKVDAETTTQNDINLGIVNILVGFAPLKPAEFVIIRIQQLAGQVQA